LKSKCLIIALFVVCIILSAVSVPAIAGDPVYKIGVVPQFEARRLHQIWQPILNHLERETGYTFELSGSPTIPAFESEFMQGIFDFVYLNPYHLVIANKEMGYTPLVRDIGKKLFGVLVVSKSGNVKDVKDLAGKVVAFPAPNALGASLQMRQELTDLFGIEISPRYVKTHDSVYLNVLLGEAAAGGGVQKTLDQQKDDIKNNLKLIHKTTPVAPHPFAVHPRVPNEVANDVKRALLALGETQSGKKMLSLVPIKQIGKATIEDYLNLLRMGLERFYVKSN